MLQKSDLRPYQQRTVTAFYERAEVQAVLPMGAGKTAAALTAIAELIDDGEIRCALVLAPKRVAQLVWPNEAKQWEHLKGLRVQLVSGGPAQRMLLLNQPADVFVIGVDNTQWLVDDVLKHPASDHPFFDCLVIDELSRFKNPRSKRAKALMKVRKHFKNMWGLTGTPRPNGYEDQFKPLALLTDNKLRGTDEKTFDAWQQKRFIRMVREDDGTMKIASAAIPPEACVWVIREEWEARTIAEINKVTVTIDEADMPELPELTTVVHWVDLPADARKAYDDMERHLVAEIRKRGIAAVSSGVAAGKLAQIANGYIYADGAGDVEHLHSAKYELLEEMLLDLEENALIAYEYKEGLRLLQAMLPGLPYLGAGVSDTKAASHERHWNMGVTSRLALHPASAGHGLNLQHGGSQMIWPELTWSAELYDQTVKRFHRPGQKKLCFNHLILARDTIDEEKYNRVVMKMGSQSAFVRLLKKV
jgi:hypothetical protein